MSSIYIRAAKVSDAEALLNIYTPYVEKTAVSFEYTVPTLTEFETRIREITEKYPYIVAIIDDTIVGYAYAGPFRVREAYKYSVETSIYVDKKFRGNGIGKKLYHTLEKILQYQNFCNMYAGVTYTDTENDPHLTKRSLLFHQRLHFVKVAHYSKCGYKFGKWYDLIFLEKHIRQHDSAPAPIIPFSEISNLDAILENMTDH